MAHKTSKGTVVTAILSLSPRDAALLGTAAPHWSYPEPARPSVWGWGVPKQHYWAKSIVFVNCCFMCCH